MAEEFDNYRAMLEEARRLTGEGEPPRPARPEGVALNEDLDDLEARLQERFDLLFGRYEELHARVWQLEERLAKVEQTGTQ